MFFWTSPHSISPGHFHCVVDVPAKVHVLVEFKLFPFCWCVDRSRVCAAYYFFVFSTRLCSALSFHVITLRTPLNSRFIFDFQNWLIFFSKSVFQILLKPLSKKLSTFCAKYLNIRFGCFLVHLIFFPIWYFLQNNRFIHHQNNGWS